MSQFINKYCFTHSLFPHSASTNAACREWKNLFLLPFSLFWKPLSSPQGGCEGAAGGKERRMYKILIPHENVACPLHLTLRTPSAQYVVIPNNKTLASHQALHTPKHYHMSSHLIGSCLSNLFDETQIAQRKKKKKASAVFTAVSCHVFICCCVVLWDWNTRRCSCIIHTKLRGHYAMK